MGRDYACELSSEPTAFIASDRMCYLAAQYDLTPTPGNQWCQLSSGSGECTPLRVRAPVSAQAATGVQSYACWQLGSGTAIDRDRRIHTKIKKNQFWDFGTWVHTP